MAEANRCPNCGSERPANAPKGLCPRCLLQQGLNSEAFSVAKGGEPAATLALLPASGQTSALVHLAETIGPVPRVLLRDTDSDTEPGPVVKPGSPEMPGHTDPAARLQLLGEIAHGGMGAILKGRDSDIGRDLAVKVLLEQHRDNPELSRRFIEEAQIAGQLQHPGVVPIYELGAFVDGRPYFTMKLVKGRTLADVLAARPDSTADQSRILGVFLQVCQTVAYAHARGVIHRDLKPSNVMVGSFGEVQVMDWGLAKVLPRGGASADATAGVVDNDGTIIATNRSDSDAERSLAGSVLGTPAYMAPEQARGEIDRVDERSDVFALGSILSEILTGRPAFTGRNSGEIQRKAARGDLAEAFARLESSGADAELRALARLCLAAEPEDRPRDAGSVVSRLSAYLAGVQERLHAAELARAAESARAEEAQARVALERSRRRRTVALAASLLAMTTLGGLAFTYIAHERQTRSAAVDRLLGRATTLVDQARAQPDDAPRWRTALAAVQQVEDDPAGIAPVALARLALLKEAAASGLRDADRDLVLRQALVEARANEADAGAASTDAAYAEAFGAAQLDVDALSVNEGADRLRRRPAAVVVELAAYLDHWSGVRRAAQRSAALWQKPLELARLADADDYRDRLRALLMAEDRTAAGAQLKAMASEPQAAELPAPTAVLLGDALESVGDREAAVDLLRRAVARHPDDVWVNFRLAGALSRLKPMPVQETVQYYAAGRALRPEMAHDLAHRLADLGRGADAIRTFRDLVDRRPDNLWHLACFGSLLKAHGQTDEASKILARAVAAARAALELRPDDGGIQINLGVALAAQGKPAEAEAAYRAGLKRQPGFAEAHTNLGIVLLEQGKRDDAVAEYRAALKLNPDLFQAHYNLANVLWEEGNWAEVEAEYRAVVELKPDRADAHMNLGRVLTMRGRPAQAEAEFRTAVALNPNHAESHYNLADALVKQGKPGEAEPEFRAALKLKPDSADIHYDFGNALGVEGKPAEAEAEFRAALKLKPDYAEAHCNLGHLLRRGGRYADAVEELRRGHELGSRQPGWSYPSAQWLRDVERLVALDPRLPAVLKGDDRPADLIERLTFIQLCSDRKLHAGAARLFADALRIDPKLADDRRLQYAYYAACAAALAGCGQSKDDPPPDQAARTKLRGQALAWLNGELAAWSRTVDDSDPKVRVAIYHVLTRWKADSNLAGVRNEAEIAKLPEDERQAWRGLWKDVDNLLKKAQGDHR